MFLLCYADATILFRNQIVILPDFFLELETSRELYIAPGAIRARNLFDFPLWGLFKLLELHLLCQEVTNGETKIETTDALGNVEVELVARHFVTVGDAYLGVTGSHATSYTNQALANHVVE